MRFVLISNIFINFIFHFTYYFSKRMLVRNILNTLIRIKFLGCLKYILNCIMISKESKDSYLICFIELRAINTNKID